jgi:hypothetical protein
MPGAAGINTFLDRARESEDYTITVDATPDAFFIHGGWNFGGWFFDSYGTGIRIGRRSLRARKVLFFCAG